MKENHDENDEESKVGNSSSPSSLSSSTSSASSQPFRLPSSTIRINATDNTESPSEIIPSKNPSLIQLNSVPDETPTEFKENQSTSSASSKENITTLRPPSSSTSTSSCKCISIDKIILIIFFILILSIICIIALSLLTIYQEKICPTTSLLYNNNNDQNMNENISINAIKNVDLEKSTTTTTIQNSSQYANIINNNNNNNWPIVINSSINNKKISVEHFDLRLPKSITPISYNITIIPFLIESTNFTFNGEISILIKIHEDCNNITLHVDQLTITSTVISQIYNYNSAKLKFYQNIKITQQYFYEKNQFYIIKLNDTLKRNRKYRIFMKFNGILNNYLQGFYRSSYSLNGTKRWIAATQFQPTDARRAFPCFDEPGLKATFIIRIGHPKTMKALSNMPLDYNIPFVENLPDYTMAVFEESVPMSTYLVAFTVMDFDSIRLGRLIVWARTAVLHSATFASEIAVDLLKFYEEFFQIEFPIPKLDMIALPDFMSGAMENWGLITFRESTMLYDELISTGSHQQSIAIVIAHEMSHQWFGNLVTPIWWSDLWLNEGFATYLESVGVNAVKPQWKVLDQFLFENQAVFQLDALANSRQLHVSVANRDELNEIFDRISYGKGAAIIRMMYHFLTPSVFQEGLNDYLTNKKFDVAHQEDLWLYLTIAAHKHKIFDESITIKDIMDTWTLQTGFPVLTVTRQYSSTTTTTAITNGKHSWRMQQKRFMYRNVESDGDVKDDVNRNKPQTWWIPITYTTSKNINFNNTKPLHWMYGNQSDQPIQIIDDLDWGVNDWLIVNVQQTALYRVNYDERNWQKIIKYLQNTDTYNLILNLNRAQLIDDSMNLARANQLHYDIALNLTKYLKYERDYVPWKTAIQNLNYLDAMICNEAEYGHFQKYYLSLLNDIYEEIDFDAVLDKNDIIESEKRIEILTTACNLQMYDCVEKCINLFQSWMELPFPDRNNPIIPDLRSIVYCTAIRNGNQMEWDFLWTRLQNTTISSEIEVIITSLGCTEIPWLISRYLQRAFSEDFGIRKHDIFRVFYAVSNSYIGQFTAFNYLRNQWKQIKSYLDSSPSNLHPLAAIVSRKMNQEIELNEFITFIKNNFDVNNRSIRQSLEIVELNVIWKKLHFKTISEWILKQSM